jgi:3-hydroxyacyl-CoA dehydrogenase
MINEAIETLYNKVAGVYEIDTVMKLEMGHPMGPLQLADFIVLQMYAGYFKYNVRWKKIQMCLAHY